MSSNLNLDFVSKYIQARSTETDAEKLARFESLNTKERKSCVQATMNEWSREARSMDFGQFISKWNFLQIQKGLFLAFKLLKGLKNLDHLTKRFGRLAEGLANNTQAALINAMTAKLGDTGRVVYHVI